MTRETSPFLWDSKTIKIKNTLDRFIAIKPETIEIPLFKRDYEALLKTINPRIRHLHENDLLYHGRKLVVRGL